MMEKNDFRKNLQAIKDKLPHGWIKEVTGGNPGQKLRLNSMFKKESVAEMTQGEKEMLEKFLAYARQNQTSTEALTNEVAKISSRLK